MQCYMPRSTYYSDQAKKLQNSLKKGKQENNINKYKPTNQFAILEIMEMWHVTCEKRAWVLSLA